MIRAVIRLFAIAFGSVFLILFAVFLVRRMGEQQTFAAPPHPWFQKPYWQVYSPPDICQLKGQMPKVQAGDIVLVTVRFKEDNWQLDCPEQNLKLSELLQNTSQKDWILKVKAVEALHLENLVEVAGAYDREMKFGIISDSQRVSRALRKLAPQWLYASDASTLLRLQMFASLWIETAMDFWPDFVVAGQDVTLPSHLNARLSRELERRSKRIIWDETKGDAKPDFPVQGVVTNRTH